MARPLNDDIKVNVVQYPNHVIGTKSFLEAPYHSNQSILILGEQDFTLSLAIKCKYNPQSLVATAYYKEPPQESYWNNIDRLATLGSTIKFNIDATNLTQSLLNAGVDLKYDRIIFTFPRSSELHNDAKNRAFIKSLCSNASKCLNEPNGQLHLMLHFNERHLQCQYDHWKVYEVPDWIHINQLQFDLNTITKQLFPGYVPTTENGKTWKPMLPVMCIMTPDFDAKKKKARDKQIESDLILALSLFQNQDVDDLKEVQPPMNLDLLQDLTISK